MATSLVNGNPRFSDPQGSKNPEPINIKLDRGDYIGDLTPHAYFGISTLKGAGLHMRKLSLSVSIFYHLPTQLRYFLLFFASAQIAPFGRFSWFTWF